jgi:hypothetical protein
MKWQKLAIYFLKPQDNSIGQDSDPENIVALIFSHDPNVHPCSRRFKILEWLCYSPS